MFFMDAESTVVGSLSQPHSVAFGRYRGNMTDNEVKTALATNIRALMARKQRPATQHELAKMPGVSVGSAGRILGGVSDVRLETINAVAAALELEAWQLLVPYLDPDELPQLGGASSAWPFDPSLLARLRNLSPKSRYIIEGRLEEAIRDRESMESQRAAM